MKGYNSIILYALLCVSCSGMLDDYDYNADHQRYMETVLHGDFTINNDEYFSYTPGTVLHMDVHNAVEMRFRNDNETWADTESGWIPIHSTVEWQLPPGCHSRTVYGQFRDQNGSLIESEDSIELIDMIKATNGESSDEFGSAIAVSNDGQTVVVGCPLADNRNNTFPSVDEGVVFIYTWNTTSGKWDEYTLYGTGTAGDNFGYAVDVSGNGKRIIVGAYKNDANFATDDNRGSAYIFERPTGGASWNLMIQLFEPGSDRYGNSVTISNDGTTVAVGAMYDNSVYVYSGPAWTLTKKLQPSAGIGGVDYNYYGTSVSLSGNGTRLAVGSPGAVVANGRAGYVYVYSGSGPSWSEEQLSIGALYDYFGWDVALSHDGLVLVVGAKGHEVDNWRQGTVHVYRHNGSNWGSVYDLVLPVSAGSDTFGYSVSINGDGSSLVASSLFTDLFGNDHGGAFFYTWSGSAYVLSRELYASDGESNDYFGCDVSLSGDGATIASGLLHDTVRTEKQGSVYIFKND